MMLARDKVRWSPAAAGPWAGRSSASWPAKAAAWPTPTIARRRAGPASFRRNSPPAGPSVARVSAGRARRQGVRRVGPDRSRSSSARRILVNNAGVAQVLPFAMIEEDDWDQMMDVNVKGMFLVTKAFARGMIRRKRGSIVNMGSLAGMRMLEVPVHYATAKSAVVGFTLSLARELGRYSVRVNAVVPGMLTDGVSVNVPARNSRKSTSRYCALSRVGTPEEVAELVAFLASDRRSYINGQADHGRRRHLMKFRMVDRILAWEPRRSDPRRQDRFVRGIRAQGVARRRAVPAGEPDAGKSVPVGQLAGDAVVRLSPRWAWWSRFEEIRFLDRLRPGQPPAMEVEVRSWRDDGSLLDGGRWSGERTIAEWPRLPGAPVPSGRLPRPR